MSAFLNNWPVTGLGRDGIVKPLGSRGIDSKESIPPAYVAWQAGTTTLIPLNSEPPQIVLKFQLWCLSVWGPRPS